MSQDQPYLKFQNQQTDIEAKQRVFLSRVSLISTSQTGPLSDGTCIFRAPMNSSLVFPPYKQQYQLTFMNERKLKQKAHDFQNQNGDKRFQSSYRMLPHKISCEKKQRQSSRDESIIGREKQQQITCNLNKTLKQAINTKKKSLYPTNEQHHILHSMISPQLQSSPPLQPLQLNLLSECVSSRIYKKQHLQQKSSPLSLYMSKTQKFPQASQIKFSNCLQQQQQEKYSGQSFEWTKSVKSMCKQHNDLNQPILRKLGSQRIFPQNSPYKLERQSSQISITSREIFIRSFKTENNENQMYFSDNYLKQNKKKPPVFNYSKSIQQVQPQTSLDEKKGIYFQPLKFVLSESTKSSIRNSNQCIPSKLRTQTEDNEIQPWEQFSNQLIPNNLSEFDITDGNDLCF